MTQFSRRHLLKAALAAPALSLVEGMFADVRAQKAALKFGAERKFSFDGLKARARQMAGQAYVPPYKPKPDVTNAIDYDAHGKIRFNTDLAINGDRATGYPVTFFHLGRYAQKKVTIHLLEDDKAREVLYSPSYFEMPEDSPARKLPQDSGFAGFRLQESTKRDDWRKQDWVAFQGASYFRAIGDLNQYGLSARGVAIDVASPYGSEEFPDFTEFWIEAGEDEGQAVIYALLDGPSIAGAYKFSLRRRKGVEIEVECDLHMRRSVYRLGIAPLTSMYWFSETRKPTMVDWRPEVHDSDGLEMWTGSGERIWRPLNNPPRVQASAFSDDNPRGFGIMQRDREFKHYLDGVHYQRRPSLWVEPLGKWGAGSVQLIEIPTDDEIHDNIVAFWVPAAPAKAGSRYSFSYRTFWQDDAPYPGELARCVATRLGNGGQPGQPRPAGVRKFLLEFVGGPLKNIPYGKQPEPVLWASRGTFGSYIHSEAVPNDVPGHWRTQFDLASSGSEPIDMRCYLRLGDQVLSETWLFQYHPQG